MEKVLMRNMLPGQKGIVCEVTARGDLGRRIFDMGLVPGTPAEMLGRAPLLDPVAVSLTGFTLSLRNNEADFITLEKETP